MDQAKEHYYSTQDISFHFASSDRDLIEKVSKIMKRNGHVSFSDSMGNEHYIIDGRKGATELTRHIDLVSRRIKEKNKDEFEKLRPYFSGAIEKVLKNTGIPVSLKGFRYIRCILYRLIEDDTLLSPISKTVYPILCDLYACNIHQIERDIRYAIKKSSYHDKKLSPKTFICTLLEVSNNLATEMYLDSLKFKNI